MSTTPTLGQITYLVDRLTTDTWIKAHYDVGNWDRVYEKVHCITDAQRRHVWVLILNQNYEELGRLLETFNFKRTPLSADETAG